MLLISRLLLVISILGFVVSCGSCASCIFGQNPADETYQYYGDDGRWHSDKGISDKEKALAPVIWYSYLVFFLAGLAALVTYRFAEPKEVIQEREIWINSLDSMTLEELKKELVGAKNRVNINNQTPQIQSIVNETKDLKKRISILEEIIKKRRGN